MISLAGLATQTWKVSGSWGDGRALFATGDDSRSTIVSSASNISLRRSLGLRIKEGCFGCASGLGLLALLSFLEKIPDVQVWYLRLLEEEDISPEDVLGLPLSPKICSLGGCGVGLAMKTSIGSDGSTFGVLGGESISE